VAKKLSVHRRMVREAIGSALPKPRKKPERPRWKLKTAVQFVDAILEADRKAPRKQRHTAHRIWTRMQHELPECKIAERTVREYVHDRKIALGLMVRETCVPQSYTWGVEAQIDWYEAYADLAGERIKLQVFAMRSMASGATFHCAYLHATQQAFLEAHELAFTYFGGVFRKLRYDNLASAVKKILRGHRREETARFVAFRSHWRFEAEFCTPAEPHEKGGIEGEAGYFRRNHWVPVPEAEDVAEINRQLLIACQHDERRVIAGREQMVGAGMVIEREHLLPLATEGVDLAHPGSLLGSEVAADSAPGVSSCLLFSRRRRFAFHIQSVGNIPVQRLADEGSSGHPLAIGGFIQTRQHVSRDAECQSYHRRVPHAAPPFAPASRLSVSKV
jgi:transposase